MSHEGSPSEHPTHNVSGVVYELCLLQFERRCSNILLMGGPEWLCVTVRISLVAKLVGRPWNASLEKC